jgi:hypothetical protein
LLSSPPTDSLRDALWSFAVLMTDLTEAEELSRNLYNAHPPTACQGEATSFCDNLAPLCDTQEMGYCCENGGGKPILPFQNPFQHPSGHRVGTFPMGKRVNGGIGVRQVAG